MKKSPITKKKTLKLKSKTWKKPQSEVLRLGFEVTLYVQADPGKE